MNRDYPMHIFLDDDGECKQWVAEYPDLPGCSGVGNTREEALSEAEIHKNIWLDAAEENGEELPEASEVYSVNYSGKFNTRIAKTLHRDLAIRAEIEGISLNSLVQTILANGVHKSFSQVAAMKIDVTPEETTVNYQVIDSPKIIKMPLPGTSCPQTPRKDAV